MLLFKKKFIPAILSGNKTQTIRLWKSRRLRVGQRSYIPGAGYIFIDSVDLVRLNELTDADAIPDGFATAHLLRQEIEHLYPLEIASEYQAYRVRFTLLPEKEQKRISEERKKQKEIQKQLGLPQRQKKKTATNKEHYDLTMEKIKKMASGNGTSEN